MGTDAVGDDEFAQVGQVRVDGGAVHECSVVCRSLAIHLLGPRPSVVRAGRPQPAPCGRKVCALLGYLLTTESAPSRGWLSELLFADADDPLNALSWNLTQLRRLLGPKASIGGEPGASAATPERSWTCMP
ncbi:MAG TPA: hypothetical protein VFI46_02455 [Jiangellaceae bacterium]|nr:hypothetical protein [Jiangellaceae bacterium]